VTDTAQRVATAHVAMMHRWVADRQAAEQRVLLRYANGEMERALLYGKAQGHRAEWVTKIYNARNTPDGICRWCGLPVTEPRRRNWHADCKAECAVFDWNYTRHYVLMYVEMSGGKCAQCKHPFGYALEVHHKRRLADWPSPEAHFLSNLRALCADCHKAAHAHNPPSTTPGGLFQAAIDAATPEGE
jgi:5-methylcytosine-specific restriction endonuclease McrA